MVRLIWAVLVLAGIYAGYWALGAQGVQRGAEAALVQARAEGWGDAAGLRLAGFPSRFDLTVERPQLRDPAGRWDWRAPWAQALTLSYRPNEVIFVLPGGQDLTLGRQRFGLDLADLRGSLRVGVSPDLPVQRAVAVLQDGVLRPDRATAPMLAARELRLALQAVAEAVIEADAGADAVPGPRYRLGAEVLDLDLPAGLARSIAPGVALPDRLARLHLDAEVTLSAPLDRHVAATRPRWQGLDLADLSLDWGGREMAVAGALRQTASGQPEGTLRIRSVQWRDWLALAVAAGWVSARQVPLLEGLGAHLAGQNPEGAVEVPLAFENGRMALGPVPLGAAPVLR